jgi:hypothetical protein
MVSQGVRRCPKVSEGVVSEGILRCQKVFQGGLSFPKVPEGVPRWPKLS